jgi:hypothetical protein
VLLEILFRFAHACWQTHTYAVHASPTLSAADAVVGWYDYNSGGASAIPYAIKVKLGQEHVYSSRCVGLGAREGACRVW